MDWDGLSCQAALTVGWGAGACMVSVVLADPIFTFTSG